MHAGGAGGESEVQPSRCSVGSRRRCQAGLTWEMTEGQRLAMKNVEDGLRDIYANGHQNNIIDKMQTRKRLYELVDYEKYNSLDEKIYNFSTEGHE